MILRILLMLFLPYEPRGSYQQPESPESWIRRKYVAWKKTKANYEAHPYDENWRSGYEKLTAKMQRRLPEELRGMNLEQAIEKYIARDK